MLKNYVISLAHHNKRQSHIQQEFAKQHIPFTFFSAVTPDKNTQVAQRLAIDITKSVSSDTEIACFLSHASLCNAVWMKILIILGFMRMIFFWVSSSSS